MSELQLFWAAYFITHYAYATQQNFPNILPHMSCMRCDLLQCKCSVINVLLHSIIFYKILHNRKRCKADILTGHKTLRKAIWAKTDGLLKRYLQQYFQKVGWTKWVKLELFRKRLFLFAQTRKRLEEVFLSIYLPRNNLSFEYLHFSSTHWQIEKIRSFYMKMNNCQLCSISDGWVWKERETEIWKNISGCTK